MKTQAMEVNMQDIDLDEILMGIAALGLAISLLPWLFSI